jgi:hypothetical protein
VLPTPINEKTYGLSLESLFAIEAEATLTPSPPGLNRIAKVVVSSGNTGVEGWVVTEKSDACVPLIWTLGVAVKLRGEPPRFSIVKVAEIFDPRLTGPKS